MPTCATANNHCVGVPPKVLLDLTEVELALLTPVKTDGHCFNFTGGPQKMLKGSLTCFKVDTSNIVRSVAQFDVLNMHKNTVVLVTGQMTPEQRRRAKEKKRSDQNVF